MSADQGSILDKIISTQQFSRKEHFRPQEVLAEIMRSLNEREAQVVMRRFGLPDNEHETLESVGKSFNITRERVRQIEKLVINKIKANDKMQDLLSPVRAVIVETLETEGGAMTEDHLLKSLNDTSSQDVPKNTLSFYLNFLLDDVVSKISDENFLDAWMLKTASLDALKNLSNIAKTILEKANRPLSDEILWHEMSKVGNLLSPLGDALTDVRVTVSLLEISNDIKRNPYGEWGLTVWDTITPKRMSDKIYLVLKKKGSPLHFREITNLINDQKFDHKQAHAPTVHNELILDSRFVLVGRGIYALSEWGYKPGAVADVIVEIIKQKGPLTRDEVVTEVLSRRVVQAGTIHLALTNKKIFIRNEQGKYTLANQN